MGRVRFTVPFIITEMSLAATENDRRGHTRAHFRCKRDDKYIINKIKNNNPSAVSSDFVAVIRFPVDMKGKRTYIGCDVLGHWNSAAATHSI